MNWYKIQNNAGVAEISIHDRIGKTSQGGISSKQFINELKLAGIVHRINLHINSPGGSVVDGIAIFNALVSHPAKVFGYIDGIAASIATVILCACDKVYMPANALYMIHDPSSIAMGTVADFQKSIHVMNKMKESAITAYQRKSHLSRARISQLMTNETWMDAEEAKQNGFVDEITGAVNVAAHFDLSGFLHPPQINNNKGNNMNQETFDQLRNMDEHQAEQFAKNQWDSDGELRKEFFNDYQSFKAYCMASAGGLVKLMGGAVKG